MNAEDRPHPEVHGRAQRILVIKHGALGDFVLATGPLSAIRSHHSDAHITLLTTAPYAELARQSGWFDAVWLDDRAKPWQLGAVRALRRKLRSARFARVYDLQTSSRSSSYFRLFGRPRPEWSGIAKGCSHPHTDPDRDKLHTIERQADQLKIAGIADVPGPDVSWLDADITRLHVRDPYVLLIPGGAAHRPRKRWPADRYAELARALAAGGIRPVLIGTTVEADALNEITSRCTEALNLCGKTELGEIAALARGAAGAVGNDTGPMHLIAAVGCPALVLYSSASHPALTAPPGGHVEVLRVDDLGDLPVAQVREALPLRRWDADRACSP